MSRRNNGKRGEINKLDIMRQEMERMRKEEEMRKEEMERMRKEEEMQKEEMERMQRGVTFTMGQDDGPLDRVARGNFQPFVPRMSLQNYENAEKEKADSLEFQARRNSRNDEARRKYHNDLLEDSLQNYDMSDFQGGKRKKKKYTQTRTRQKKQHRRRRRRHSTRKHKK
jgi:hypothetical protein